MNYEKILGRIEALEADVARLTQKLIGELAAPELPVNIEQRIATLEQYSGMTKMNDIDGRLDQLEAGLRLVRFMSDPIKEFAQRIILDVCFDNRDLDGSYIQDMAYDLGLLKKTKYDPDIHDSREHIDVEPGDDWYEFSELMK